MAPARSAASGTDARHNWRCTGYMGQPTEKPQRGIRVRLPARLTWLLRTPYPRQPGGRGSGGVGGGGELGGLGGEEAGLLHCLHPAAPARTQPERVEPPPAPAGSRRWSAAQLSSAQHHRSAEQTELESGALSPEAGNEEGRCCLQRHGPAAPAAAAAVSRGKWLAGGTPVNLFKELNPEGI